LETIEEKGEVAREIQTAVKHSAVYGLGNVLAKALGFLMLPVYTHFLNPVDYGILEILDLSMSLIGMFLNMGITAAVLRSYASAGSDEERKTTISTAFWFILGIGLVTFLLVCGFVRPISALIFGPTVPYKYLLMSFASFILGFVANLPRTYLRALEASTTFVVTDTAGLFLLLILNIVFIAVLHIGLMGILLSSLIVAALQVVLLSGWTLHKVGIHFRGYLLKAMLAFGLPLVLSNMSLFTLNFSDRFFLQHLRSLDMVGVYAVGYKFGYMLNYLLVQPFFVMWQSRMFAIHALPGHHKIFGRFFTLYALVLTYAGLGLAILSPEIVRFMVAPKFAASEKVIPIVTLAYIFYGIGYYVQVGMFITNRTGLIGAIGAAAAVLNLTLNYFLVLHYGMMGAAWATLLSFFAIAVASYWVSNRVYPLPLRVGRISLAILLAVVMYLGSQSFQPGSEVAAVALKLFLLAVFPLVLWKVRILSPDEIEAVISTRDNILAGAARMLPFRKAAGA
jgi:O-antigen/teichoic acid export membrane protein